MIRFWCANCRRRMARSFMRKIAPRSGAFSHLDRLSTIPRGQSIVRDLVRQKDGDKMIEYMATTKGGKNMSGMMAKHVAASISTSRLAESIPPTIWSLH